MRIAAALCLHIFVQGCSAVAPECEEDRESTACYDAIETPLTEIAKTAVKIPLKLTMQSARDPMNTFRGAVQFLREGGRSSMVFFDAMVTLSGSLEDIVERNDPGDASSELVMFAAQAVRLLITSENFTDNPLLRQSISSVTPDLLYINRQALKVVNRVGGPRRYFYLPVLYFNDIGLNFLRSCKTTVDPPRGCDIMQKTVLKSLEVVEGLPLIVKTFGRPLREFLLDEE